ncbi:hypothetical protein GALMADRAFT_134915 [Galerina marginata CBS 339.88]|uniref:Uncharacterized protein n=1 Tax=Galerina marginata (strain CBS 339.88) TaxID=685588 RepID=A0A067TRB5_GALM3|nr:hypothetical protein GALMADRAFT_134915 [Galerina marginata CBS 339.88]
MSTSGATAQDSTWKAKEQSQEAHYIHQREQAQLEAIRLERADKVVRNKASEEKHTMDKDFEGGFGGQEDLEDRYATTSGEH